MNRFYRFTKPNGEVAPLAIPALDAIAAYAGDEKSAFQAIVLLDSEYQDYRQNPSAWTFSDLTMSVIDAVNRRSAQIYISGVVALLLLHLNKDGSPISLNRASSIASELFYEADSVMVRVPKAGAWEFRKQSLTGDEKTIQRIFRQYRPAASICAAKVLFGDSLAGDHPLLKPLPWTMSFLSTVLHYQSLIENLPASKEWGLWKVWGETGDIQTGYPPKVPTEEDLDRARKRFSKA